MNRKGLIRDLTLSAILKDYQPSQKVNPHESYDLPEILLIDEVDVFFSKDFYNQQYRPQAQVIHENVVKLLDYVWNHKSTINYFQLTNSTEYKECLSIFKDDYKGLVTEACKDMINDIKAYDNEDHRKQYKVYNGKEGNGRIGYIDQDRISFNKRFGY